VRPVRGQLLRLRLSQPAFSSVVWGGGTYLVPWEDGTVLVGATMEEVGFDERATVAGVRQLLDGGEQLLPALAGAQFDEVRVGLRPATSDDLPIIGASSVLRGLYYATGHFRNGVLLAPLTARLIADVVAGGVLPGELAPVRPERFGL
jgi:glycine oxidase